LNHLTLAENFNSSPAMTINVFAVPVFFVVFREMLETVVIVSVLLAFLNQTLGGPNRDDRTYKKLVKQVRVLIQTKSLVISFSRHHRSGMAPSQAF
jgi:high-affinity Fe2+/Pb2+ permease